MQPRYDVSIAARPPEVQGRRSASVPRLPPASAPLDRSALLTDLSATVCQIRGLQQRLGDDGLQGQLRRTATELETLITALLRKDGSGPSPPVVPATSVSAPHQRPAERAFSVWLAEPTSANESLLAYGDEPEALARALGELSLSRQVLPAGTAADVGLPDGTTIGHAAVEVLLAVKDPAGPRCRSYRAAVFYLRDLDRDRFAWAGDGKGCR
ncbi:MAG: hypothetical protein EA388_03455 [Nitriliruptor sp.]|nr:MAG: hypothetical protein EA388_03455 [Nitriliruptor sp.]